MKLFDLEKEKNLLLYLMMPYFLKKRFFTGKDVEILNHLNQSWNTDAYTESGSESYDEKHGYEAAEGSGYPFLPILADIFPPQKEIGRVLEIGAGSGFLMTKLMEQASHWVAIEIAPTLANRTRKIGNASGKGFQLIEKDIASVECDENQFDTIFLINTLHHLTEREKVFKKIYNWLKPGGKLYCLDPRHNLQRAMQLMRKYFQIYRKNPNQKLFATHDFTSKIEMRGLYRSVGFQHIQISAYDFPFSKIMAKDPYKKYKFENRFNFIPLIEHFGRFLFSSAVKP